MIVTKTEYIKEMPRSCDFCPHYETRPHPYKGWTDICGLCVQCMDDDAPEQWHWDGNGRPNACPLMEFPDMEKLKEIIKSYAKEQMPPDADYKDGFNAGLRSALYIIDNFMNDKEEEK